MIHPQHPDFSDADDDDDVRASIGYDTDGPITIFHLRCCFNLLCYDKSVHIFIDPLYNDCYLPFPQRKNIILHYFSIRVVYHDKSIHLII